MARGPFQGTFQPNLRPTVVHGPDAIVYINGESDVIGCPSCRKKFDLNAYITSIQVDLSVESAPGSASISLSIPRHALDDFYFEGNPLITPMMEVEIFSKGYYLVEGVPQYYPIFWGLVTEVGNSYSGGEHTVSIQCADILKWWELCRMNIHPAYTAAAGQADRSIFGNVFFGMNPYDIIWTCAQQAFGDVVTGSGSLVTLIKEKGAQRQVFVEALSDIMAYWEERFSRTRGNLLLYGVNGVVVRGDSLYEAWTKKNKGEAGKPFASTAVRNANGGVLGGQAVFDVTDPAVTAFRTQFSQASQVNFWTSEFQTKLELANTAKEAIGFEFFMDVTGEIVFKPPFYNLDILSNKPVSWIQDIDVIDWDFSESEAEVVTQITLQGSWGGNTDYGFPEDITPYTSVTDYHLLRKYGWRPHPYNSEFMGDTQLMFYHGMDILDRLNSKRHRGSVTIPMRPELRLGFPIYVAPLDQVWYIQGISHNIAFGSRATTTLTLTAKRQKFFAPKGIGTIKLDKYSGPSLAETQPSASSTTTKNAVDTKQKKVPAPKPKLPFRYSAKQLGKYASFTVNVGLGATVPPSAEVLKKTKSTVSGDNPYDPLVLRHPKTGRALGYPNVNMIYTRPFAPPLNDLAERASIDSNSLQQLVSTEFGTKVMKENLTTTTQGIAKSFIYSSIDKARDTLLSNRYQYGLTSAGVFSYVYDVDKVIGEVTFIPATNMRFVGASEPFKFDPRQTGMIRPVSDERGFEVIGHFRYGRGLALRDGSLVFSPNELNKQASVNLQVALSGDLFGSLTAQSQGLTTISTVYENPVDAITTLIPSDLQSAAVKLPSKNTGETAFVGGSKNFVDTAPLGSAVEQGTIYSVEASQLSRALTIAELGVLKDPGSADVQCSCLAGRSDLAFINVGYKVKPLFANTMGGVAPATGTLPTPTAATDPETLNADEASGGPLTDTSYRAALGGQGVIQRIETFLFNLYSALDKPHQALEASLRGTVSPEAIRGAGSTGEIPQNTKATAGPNKPGPSPTEFGDPPSPLSPPFNPASRFAVGDPEATALQATSAASNLTQTWETFGSKLRKNMTRAELEAQIKSAQEELGRVTKQLDYLMSIQDAAKAGKVILVPPWSDQVASLEKEKAKILQQIKDYETQLQQLK